MTAKPHFVRVRPELRHLPAPISFAAQNDDRRSPANSSADEIEAVALRRERDPAVVPAAIGVELNDQDAPCEARSSEDPTCWSTALNVFRQ